MTTSSISSTLVSVIIPAFNCQTHVSECIESILNQTYSNIEILICDDFSTDNTAHIINKYNSPNLKKYFNKEKLGVVKTRNNLILESNGELIAFQDADDWSHRNRIRDQVNLLQSNSHIGICSTGFERVNLNGKKLYSVCPQTHHFQILSEISPKTHPSMCYPSIMTYKNLISKCGYFKSYFHYRDSSGNLVYLGGEDIDLLYRILEHTQIHNMSTPLYYYRTSPSSLSNAISLEQYFPSVIGPRIAYILRQQRQLTGSDFLQEGKIRELDDIRKKICAEHDIHEIYSLLAPRMADQRQGMEFLQTTLRYLAKCPMSFTTYLYVSVSLARYLLGHDTYKSIRTKLRNKITIFNH